MKENMKVIEVVEEVEDLQLESKKQTAHALLQECDNFALITYRNDGENGIIAAARPMQILIGVQRLQNALGEGAEIFEKMQEKKK